MKLVALNCDVAAQGFGGPVGVTNFQGNQNRLVLVQRLLHPPAQMKLQPAKWSQSPLQTHRFLRKKRVSAFSIYDLMESLVCKKIRFCVAVHFGPAAGLICVLKFFNGVAGDPLCREPTA